MRWTDEPGKIPIDGLRRRIGFRQLARTRQRSAFCPWPSDRSTNAKLNSITGEAAVFPFEPYQGIELIHRIPVAPVALTQAQGLKKAGLRQMLVFGPASCLCSAEMGSARHPPLIATSPAQCQSVVSDRLPQGRRRSSIHTIYGPVQRSCRSAQINS